MSDRRVPLQLDAFQMAVQFLTRVPVPREIGAVASARVRMALKQSVVYFPLVGAMIGALTAGVLVGMAGAMPVELAVVAALGFEALLTGAFHEDGFADTCDALGGGWTRDQVLEILKDSRLGTYGVLGLGLAVAGRIFATIALVREDVWLAAAAIMGAATLGRWSILWLMASVPPISDRHTQARDVGGQPSPSQLIWGSLAAAVGLLPWFWWDWSGVAMALLSAAGLIAIYRWQLLRRLGGSTGDLLGAGCYLTQLASLIVAACRLG